VVFCPLLVALVAAAGSGRSAVWYGLERAEAVWRVIGLWFRGGRRRSVTDSVAGLLETLGDRC